MTLKELISPEGQKFIQKLPKEWQVLGDFVQAETNSGDLSKTLKAEVKNPWHISGFKNAFSELFFFVDFFSGSNKTRLRAKGQLDIEGTPVLFDAVLIDAETMVFTAASTVSGLPELFLAGTGPFKNLEGWRNIFPLETANQVQFSVVTVSSGIQINTNVSTGIKKELCIQGTKICLQNPRLSVSSFNNQENENEQAAFAGAIDVTLQIGKPVRARVILDAGETAELEISGENDEGLPGPSDLLKAIGFENEGAALEKEIKSNKFLSSLYIDFLSVRFNLNTGKFVSGSIHGHLKISKYKVRFRATFPTVFLSVSLDPDTPVLLGDLVKDTYPELKGLPTDLKVSRANAQLMIDPPDFRFDLRVADLWKTSIGAMKVEFQQLDFAIRIAKGAPVTGRLGARLMLGGVNFGLFGERIGTKNTTGWHFQSNVARSNPVNLKTIVEALTTEFKLPPADWLPETELRNITLDLHTINETFELKARATVKDKLGPFETIAVDLHLKIDKQNKELPLSIKISGELKLEKSQIQFKTDLGNKNWFIEAFWEKEKEEKGLALLDFIREVDRDKKLDLGNIPEAVEKGLTLQKLSFSYYNENQALELSAINELGITLRFALVKSGAVGAILGLKYDDRLNESEIGKSFRAFEKDIAFSEAWVVLSWIPAGFKAPSKGDFSKAWPVALDKMGKGVLLSAKLNVKENATGAFKLLNNSVPNSTGSFQATGQLNFSPFGLKLALSYDKDIIFKTTGDHPLTLRKCAIEIEVGTGKASIGANGTLEFYVDEFKVESRLSFEISTQGIQLDSSTRINKGVPLFGLRKVQLHCVGFTLGVGFTPPSVRLGAEVEMTFRVKQGVKDYFGLILGFTGPIPKPEYVGMDITKISLNELIENLEENKGKKSFLPDKMAEIKAFSFVWAMKDKTKLPDGSTVNAGVSFHGLLTLNNWNAWFEFQANPSIGVSGKGQLEKIDVEGFSVKGESPDITRLHYQQGKEWLPVSNANRLLPDVKTETRVMLKGGGALVAFSTYKSPFLFANFDIRILDVIRAKADIAITDKGMKCNVVVNIPHLYYLNHNTELREDKSFLSTGDFSAGLDFDLPFSINWKFWEKGHIYVGIKGSQKISRGKDGKFFFYFSYHYHFLDISFPGPRLEIPYAPKTFGQVVDIIWDNFRKNVFDNLFNIIVKRQYPSGGGAVITTLPAGVVKKRRALRSSKQQPLIQSNLTWIDEALQETKKDAPGVLKAGRSARRSDNFLAKAKKQTDAELREMKNILEAIDESHDDMIDAGERKLKMDIANAAREIKDLKDESHKLENKIRNIWNKNLNNYRKQKFAYYDAENDFYHGVIKATERNREKAKLERMVSKVAHSVGRLSEKPDPVKGYQKRSQKWAGIAVDHHAAMVKMEVEAELEKEYLLLQKLRQKRAIVLEDRPSETTIII